MSMVYALKRHIERLVSAVATLCALLVLLVASMLCLAAVGRWLGFPVAWEREWSMYLFGWVMLGGAAYALQKGRHASVEALTARLSPRGGAALALAVSLCCALFCLKIALDGWHMMAGALLTGETTATPSRIPGWLADSHIFIGFSLLALQFFLQTLEKALSFIVPDIGLCCAKGSEREAGGSAGRSVFKAGPDNGKGRQEEE